MIVNEKIEYFYPQILTNPIEISSPTGFPHPEVYYPVACLKELKQ